MQMSQADTLQSAGLFVETNAIDPVLLTDASAECAALIESRHLDQEPNFTTAADSPGSVQTEYFWIAELTRHQAISRIVGQISLGHEKKVAINRQDPFALQQFHSDRVGHTVSVLHIDPAGGFDYFGHRRTLGIRGAKQTLKPAAGDLVRQTMPWLRHRGRNLGPDTRHTLAIY